jgi:hypothetical protein
MKRLRRLALTGSKLTDAGMKELLNRLPSLSYIQIDLQAEVDAAMAALSGFTRAASLWVGNKQTDEAARRLQKALPNTVILPKRSTHLSRALRHPIGPAT